MHLASALTRFIAKPNEKNIELVIKNCRLNFLAAAYQKSPIDIENELWNVMCTAARNAPYEGLLKWHYLHNSLVNILNRQGLYYDTFFMLSKFAIPTEDIIFTLHNDTRPIKFSNKVLINCACAHVLPDGTVGIDDTDLHTYLNVHSS